MTVTQDTEIDIFVATKIGSFKHIQYHTESSKNNKKCIENLVDVKTLQKGDEITCMRWGNKEQTLILIGRINQQIETYSTIFSSKCSTLSSPDSGHITGLGTIKDNLISSSSSGIVRIWSNFNEMKDEEASEEVNTGGKLDVMVVCDEEPVFATGGEENDLKIYNIESKEPIFTAKNLAHDWLQLRRPVWVSGVAFSPTEGGKVAAVCSRYGYVRLYDSRAQRRPVLNVEFQNMAATCIAPSFDERMYLVGFGRGQLHQVDLRVGRPDKGYKGCAGAVTDISTYRQTERLIVSTSLDRHLRVHRYETKDIVYKQYLTSKLTRVLVQTESKTPLRSCPVEIKQETAEIDESEPRLGATDDMDDLFSNMETVGETKTPKKKSKLPLKEPTFKKLKPSTEGSTSISEVASEEAIAQLLRSTEKTKRKREKKKKEKRAKSVFFNA